MTDFLSDSAQNAAQRSENQTKRELERERESGVLLCTMQLARRLRRVASFETLYNSREHLCLYSIQDIEFQALTNILTTPYYSANVITIASTTVAITIIKLTWISCSWYCSSRKFVTIPPQRDANKRTRRRNFYSKKRITPISDTETTKIPGIFDIVIL